MKYSAYQVSENDGKFVGNICELEKPDLIDDHLIIKVKHSSLNYKDALAASGAKGVAAPACDDAACGGTTHWRPRKQHSRWCCDMRGVRPLGLLGTHT